MKRRLRVHVSPIPPPCSQQSKFANPLVQTDTTIKELCTLCKPEAGNRKLETELLFLKRVNIRD